MYPSGRVSLAEAPPVCEPEIELSVVMPCLNEVHTVGRCIDNGLGVFQRLGVCGEVVVADNGSTSGSAEVARTHGARTFGSRRIGSVGFELHSLILGCLCLVLGYQTLWLWAFAGLYGWSTGLVAGRRSPNGWFRYITVERGIAVGAVPLLAGLALNDGLYFGGGEGPLQAPQPEVMMYYAMGGATLMIFGTQTIFGSFFLGMLQLTKSAET